MRRGYKAKVVRTAGGRLIDETANRILHRPIASAPTALARKNRRSNIVVSVCECLRVFTGSDLISRHEGALSRFLKRDCCSRRSVIYSAELSVGNICNNFSVFLFCFVFFIRFWVCFLPISNRTVVYANYGGRN